MQAISTKFKEGTLLNFLGFIKKYPARRPATFKKFQQSQIGMKLLVIWILSITFRSLIKSMLQKVSCLFETKKVDTRRHPEEAENRAKPSVVPYHPRKCRKRPSRIKEQPVSGSLQELRNLLECPRNS